MVYFRELPRPLAEVDDWFIGLFFEFATMYTEDSVLQAKVKERAQAKVPPPQDVLRDLGYSDEEILVMDAK